MNRKLIAAAVLILTVSSYLSAQTSRFNVSRSTSSRSGTGLFTQGQQKDMEKRQGQIEDFLVSIVGGLMRHPDPKIRSQAVQSIIGGLSGTREGTSGTNEGGIGIFRGSRETGGTRGEGSTGVGAVIFVPDLYTLLADPDPEVRDIASVGLDVLFNTNLTLMRMMDDPDPLIRRYATKVYVARGFENRDENRSGDQNYSDTEELLTLRTLLVRLKYEKDEEVRKTIADALDWYLVSGSQREGQNVEDLGTIFGADAHMLKYLEDENPEVRKNAIGIISAMDYNQRTLETFLKMLKTEQNEDVKAALQQAINDYIARSKTEELRGAGLGGR